MPKLKLTKASVDGLLSSEKETVYWDTELRGFGVRIHPTGKRTYITQGACRTSGRKRKVTLAPTNMISLREARELAQRALLLTREGQTRANSNRPDMTINDLWGQFSEQTNFRRKQRTNKEYAASFRNWISPLVGGLKVTELSPARVEDFLKSVIKPNPAFLEKFNLKGGIYPAIHARSTLSAMLSFAVTRDIIAQNHCMHVRLKQPTGSIRFLSRAEVPRLGEEIRSWNEAGKNHMALSIIQLLLLTGARKNEICSLQWSYLHLDEGVARLPDSKTGAKVLHLPSEAVEILRQQTRINGVPWVFPAASGGSHYQGLQKVWQALRKQVGVSDVRLHDMRHTFGTWSVESGTPLLALRDLLTHKNVATTEKYVHASQQLAAGASKTMGKRLSDALGQKP